MTRMIFLSGFSFGAFIGVLLVVIVDRLRTPRYVVTIDGGATKEVCEQVKASLLRQGLRKTVVIGRGLRFDRIR